MTLNLNFASAKETREHRAKKRLDLIKREVTICLKKLSYLEIRCSGLFILNGLRDAVDIFMYRAG